MPLVVDVSSARTFTRTRSATGVRLLYCCGRAVAARTTRRLAVRGLLDRTALERPAPATRARLEEDGAANIVAVRSQCSLASGCSATALLRQDAGLCRALVATTRLRAYGAITDPGPSDSTTWQARAAGGRRRRVVASELRAPSLAGPPR
eukprot:scaffold4744_cov426-Prasinococcus_capsulatus_cf.AAC.1